VVAVAGARPADRDDFVREHVRIATRECGGSARAEVDTARALAGPLSAAMPLLERGRISWQHVRVLAQETEDLDPETRREVSAQIVAGVEAASAAGVSWTPAELRQRVRRAVIAADPVAAELRAEKAAEQRHVSRRTDRDAQASLFVNGPAIGVQTIWTALDLHAAATSADDERTLDQRRFDALVDICRLASTDAALQAAAAADGSADPSYPGGAATGSTRRMLYVKDRRCGFPGCSAAVWFCDADHSVPHEQGGCTDTENCGLFCRRHHRLKTFTAWRWRRLPDGSLEWTDPSGRTWRRGPSAVLRLPEVRAIDPPDPPGEEGDVPASPRTPRAGPGPAGPPP